MRICAYAQTRLSIQCLHTHSMNIREVSEHILDFSLACDPKCFVFLGTNAQILAYHVCLSTRINWTWSIPFSGLLSIIFNFIQILKQRRRRIFRCRILCILSKRLLFAKVLQKKLNDVIILPSIYASDSANFI